MKGVPNHRIDDESLKECFYSGQDDNNKVVLDNIVGGFYGECTYAKIAEKLEKISCKNKVWSTRKSETGRNTFAVQATNNQSIDEMRENLAWMRTKIGLVLKHVSEGTKKVNAVNYLNKPPLPSNEYNYEGDTYAVNDQMGGFRSNAPVSNQENWREGQGN